MSTLRYLKAGLPGLVLLLVLTGCLPALAQNFYPVVARFTQLPPYPVYLADFSNPSQTNLSIQVQQNDRAIATRPFRIRIYVKGQGFQIQSNDLVQGEPPLTLNYGQIYNLPADQVANYFKQYNLRVSPAQYAAPFSEGAFQFGVEIIDFETNRPVSGIQWANPVWITLNDPPVWVMPQNVITITPTLPQNIVFQWAPRHTNVADVEYEFTITELLVNSGFSGNVQNLFLAQPPYYKTRTRATSLVYNPTMPPLVPGRAYAYRVAAIAKRGREDVGVFRNNGFSEIQYFNYGTPLLPPSNLRLTWNDANATEANFNWKGEANHQSFVVEIREKGANGPWRTTTINPQATGLYNSFPFNGLDPTKAYEARVTAAGSDGQRMVSTIAPLDALPLVKQTPFSITGNVAWAYNTTEEAFNQTGTLFETDTVAKPRQVVKQGLAEQQAAARRFALKEATISLYSTGATTVSATTFAQQRSTYQLIQTVSSDAQGNYEFKGEAVKLLQSAKNLFLVARYKNNAFGESVTPFTLPDKPTGALKAADMTLIASTFRYAPKLLVASATVSAAVEEVALYRLKSVVEATPYLAEEGNASPRTEIRYNNDAYVKVATFGTNAVQPKLFTNHLFNDQLVLSVREKGQEPQYFPVTGVEAVEAGQSLTVNDQFKYLPAPRRIRGVVARGTLDSLVAGAAVQVLGQPYTTGKDGRYEATIPANVPSGQAITITTIDPLDNTLRVSETVAYAGISLEQNLLLSSGAVQMTGLVLDDAKKPLAGAIVKVGGASAKSQPNGYFSLVLDEKAVSGLDGQKEAIEITADLFAPLKLPISAFTRSAVSGSGAENKAQWVRALGETASVKSAVPAEGVSPLVIADRYDPLFTKTGKRAVAILDKADIQFTKVLKKYRVKVYTADDKRSKIGMRSLTDSLTNKVYLPAGTEITVDGQVVKTEGLAGYTSTTGKDTLEVAYKNKAGGTLYAEMTQKVSLPEKPHKRDTIYTFEIRLKPASYIRGMVLDSTLFVEGLHTDADSLVKRGPDLANRLRPIAGVKVENEGVGEAETDAKGFFRILVEEGKENTLKLSRPTAYIMGDGAVGGKSLKDTVKVIAYNAAQISVSEAEIETFKADDEAALTKLTAAPTINRLAFKRGYLTRREQKIPVFTKLLMFKIVVESAARNSGVDAKPVAVKEGAKQTLAEKALTQSQSMLGNTGESYKISGKIQLDGWADNYKEGSKLFGVVKGKELSLNFKDIIVKVDPKDKANAVPVLNSINLVDTEFDALLFGYAPVKVEGNPAGEPYIRLQQIVGEPGHGKIGGSTWQFTQTKLMGFEFGKMELSKKDPEKAAKVGQFNSKDAIDNAKDQKKLDDKRAGKKEEKKEDKKDDKAKVPDKEAFLVAFATKNLEDMSENAEFAVEFINNGSERQSENAAARGSKNVQFDAEYARFPLGNTSAQPAIENKIGVAGKVLDLLGPYINVERKEVVLKKSGLSMKGSLSMPAIPFLVSDSAKLIMDKLEIDNKFDLKTASFVKADKANIWEAVIGGKTASGFLLEVKSFLIINNFKGYGIGGRISNDKDNYIDVNSLTLTRSAEGRYYPATELSLPNQGFRIKSIRLRPSGKKAIVLKPNIPDKGYELEASLNVEYDGSDVMTAQTDSTDNFGRKLTDDEKAALAQKNAAAPKSAEAKSGGGGFMSKVFPFELQKFVWSTTGKWVVSAKPRPLVLIDGMLKLEIRRMVFTKAGVKADGKPDALKLSEVNELLAMNEAEVNKMNASTAFNAANTVIKKDSAGANVMDKDGKGVREGVLSKETQDLRGNTGTSQLTIKELSEKISKQEPNSSIAFGFAGGFSSDSTGPKGMKFDSDISLVVGKFGSDKWEVSINEVMLKLESSSFRAFGKVKVSMTDKKRGFEGAIDLETVSRRFAANFKYYKLEKGIELGAGFQASAQVALSAITFTSLGGGFDLNTQDQKYKVFLVGAAVPTLTLAEPKLCQYKNLQLSVEFDGKTCGALPVIKGSGEKYVNGDRYCTVNVELDFCRVRLLAKLNCEVEVVKDSKVDLNALVIADASAGIFVGANVRADLLGGIANGLFGLPILFRTTMATASGMPPELSAYVAKIPKYLMQEDNTTATGAFIKMDVSREFKWSDRVSVAGLSVIEANVEAMIKSNADIGVNFRTGNFRVMGQAVFDAEGRVTVVGFALNGKMGLGLVIDGGFQEDKGWNLMAQARGELQVWRSNSESLSCNDYKIEREWYEDDECVSRNWYGTCKRTEKRWKQYSIFRLDKLTVKVKVCVSGSFGGQYQSRGNAGWKLLK